MKTYALPSVEYQGKKYEKCTLVINEEATQAEVQRTEGLRKKQTTMATFRYGPDMKVTVSDNTLQTQGLTMVTVDALTAAEIGRTLSMEAVALARSQSSNRLQESMANLLNPRASVVDFLSRYNANPRAALFSLMDVYSGGDKGPLEEYLENSKNELSKGLDAIRPALVEFEKTFGNSAADRVYAFVYAASKLEDSALSPEEIGDAVALLGELGITAPSEPDSNAIQVNEAILRKARTLIVPA